MIKKKLKYLKESYQEAVHWKGKTTKVEGAAYSASSVTFNIAIPARGRDIEAAGKGYRDVGEAETERGGRKGSQGSVGAGAGAQLAGFRGWPEEGGSWGLRKIRFVDDVD